MKQYEIFHSLENGNYVRETVYGRHTAKTLAKSYRAKGHKVRVYSEYGFRKHFI